MASSKRGLLNRLRDKLRSSNERAVSISQRRGGARQEAGNKVARKTPPAAGPFGQ